MRMPMIIIFVLIVTTRVFSDYVPVITSENISVDYVVSGKDFNVELAMVTPYWYGPSGEIYYKDRSNKATFSSVNVSSDGTYHIPSQESIVNIGMHVNVSGYTCWGNCSFSGSNNFNILANEPKANITVGQLYVIIDGEILDGTGHLLSRSWPDYPDMAIGSMIPVTQGDHTISFLYIGKDEVEGFKWASDSFVVRVNPDPENLDPIITQTSPLSINIADKADNTSSLYVESAYFDLNIGSWFYQPYEYKVTGNVAVSYGDDQLKDIDTIDYKDSNTEFSISGVINSSGFDDYQFVHNYTATKGHVFLVDALGVQYLGNNPTEITLRQTYPGSNQRAQTFIGLLVFAEYGRWHEGIDGIPDHDAIFGWNMDNFTYDASFDFISRSFGVELTDEPSNIRSIVTTTYVTSITSINTETSIFKITELVIGILVIVIHKKRKSFA